MVQKLALDMLPGWPAAMSQQLAAAYCGLSVDTFSKTCPVQPIAITASKTGRRYLRIRLDEWLLSLESPASPKKPRIGETLRAANRRTGMGAMWDESRTTRSLGESKANGQGDT